jgi:Transposase and inactivated derivatives
MFSLTNQIRYHVYTRTCDMRNGINGLYNIIEREFSASATSGDAFVFFSRCHDQVKILRWDDDGFVLYTKRLEKGTFEKVVGEGSHVELPWNKFCLIMQGVNTAKAVFRRRYVPFAKNTE